MANRLLGALLFFGIAATASGMSDRVEELQRGMPRPVARLISRIVECNHWSGEEGYDAGRSAEIRKAVSALRCEDLESDEKEILRQYGSSPGVRRSIEAARDLYL